jgi:formate dehydrogenase
VTINAPLHRETENLFDKNLLGQLKRGAYLINTARGRILTAPRLSQFTHSAVTASSL